MSADTLSPANAEEKLIYSASPYTAHVHLAGPSKPLCIRPARGSGPSRPLQKHRALVLLVGSSRWISRPSKQESRFRPSHLSPTHSPKGMLVRCALLKTTSKWKSVAAAFSPLTLCLLRFRKNNWWLIGPLTFKKKKSLTARTCVMRRDFLWNQSDGWVACP